MTDTAPGIRQPVLAVDELSISVGTLPLVKGVSFDIRAGETLCLVGESGSGKSVTASALAGLLAKDLEIVGGRAVLEGRDVATLSEASMRSVRGREIGFIFQEPLSALNPVMRVGDQIREVFQVHGEPVTGEDIHDLLRQVGYRDPERIAKSYPHRLSGGQRQRIVIAMAIALKPKLIIADEPTTALDVTTQAQVLSLLKDIRNEVGCAMLFITHDFGVVADIADRVVVMRHGAIVETASAKQIFESPQADYTKDLLSAVANHETKRKGDLSTDLVINASDLRKVYKVSGGMLKPRRSFVALDGVSLKVTRQETLGIIGESGSGKSTLAKALVGLVEPESGRLVIDGLDALRSRAARKQLVRRTQMVFQDPYSSLNPRRRIIDILSDGPLATGVPKAQVQSDIAEMLQLVGLPEDAARRFPHEFSGGQRQRIAIARALVMRPSILVADEPVSALDVSIQRQILDLFKTVRDKLSLTMVFITHDLRVAAEICDRLAIMREGRVVEYGWTQDILAKPCDAYTRQLLAAIPGQTILGDISGAAEVP